MEMLIYVCMGRAHYAARGLAPSRPGVSWPMCSRAGSVRCLSCLGRVNDLLCLARHDILKRATRPQPDTRDTLPSYRDFLRPTLILCGSVRVLTLIPISPLPSRIGASIAPLFNFLFILDLVSATLLFLSSFARNPPLHLPFFSPSASPLRINTYLTLIPSAESRS